MSDADVAEAPDADVPVLNSVALSWRAMFNATFWIVMPVALLRLRSISLVGGSMSNEVT